MHTYPSLLDYCRQPPNAKGWITRLYVARNTVLISVATEIVFIIIW